MPKNKGKDSGSSGDEHKHRRIAGIIFEAIGDVLVDELASAGHNASVYLQGRQEKLHELFN